MKTNPPTLAAATADCDAGLLEKARIEKDTPFDYLIVGSGAGGGPLAARLALAGKMVLVIEAGRDPVAARSREFPLAETGEVTQSPGYHGAATEDAEMSWQFSVRHYADTARQAKDDKYNKLGRVVDDGNAAAFPPTAYPRDKRFLDPVTTRAGKGQGGIFYPRSAGLGGCTGHHAMIMAAPNDKDWNYIADLTGDDSWRAGKMRGYFAKLERCLYRKAYDQWFRKLLGFPYYVWRWIVLQLDPRAVLDEGGHGLKGWQPTSFLDPALIEAVAKEDRTFLNVLVKTALGVLHHDFQLLAALKRALFKLRIVQHIDPNDLNTRRVSPEGVFLIPTGIETGDALDQDGLPLLGRRAGVREFLLKAKAEKPENLVIKMGVHVTRLVFKKEADGVPRAIGVEVAEGDHLYAASPLQPDKLPGDKKRLQYFAKGEVILCGGAFNTPQMLMLSGIGDRDELEKFNIPGPRDKEGQPLGKPIHLPGVGKNLQDRYEVSVISELDKEFSTLTHDPRRPELDGVSFRPGDPKDPAREEWHERKDGLYRTNGGTLAIIRRSRALREDEPEPDLFTFGAPAAFRGYYWGWSRELLRPTLGAAHEQRNLWSWVILKAYTHNNGGTVSLRSDSAFDCPEICFHSFDENSVDAEGWKKDLEALTDAVGFMRKVNKANAQFVSEIQPGPALLDNSDELKGWIKNQAWGHHCSCTCRIGADSWQADTTQLTDKGAVLDSRFQVHGVKGLRVVDASVFPKIPGYFILTPIFMISEKAADTVLEDAVSDVYPAPFEAAEAAAIHARRAKARTVPNLGVPARDAAVLPGDTVGLALSGGGIRSATFALGVLQTLAERNRLREVDLLSTVSGGGFIGSFLGRLFTRETVRLAGDPCGRVQDTLKDSRTGPLWWLRTQANYIFATGAADVQQNLAVFWRNIFAVHLILGLLFFTLFGLLAWLPGAVGFCFERFGQFRLLAVLEPVFAPPVVRGLELSAWWWLPVAALALGVLPGTLGFWLAPKVGSYRPYPFFALLAWLVLVAGAVAALQIPPGLRYGAGAGAVLLLAWVWQEVARWGARQDHEAAAAERQIGATVRNRLTRGLGEAMVIFAALTAWVVLDTFAMLFAQRTPTVALAAAVTALGPLLPLLQKLALSAKKELALGDAKNFSLTRLANLLGIPLALGLLWVVDVLAHQLVAGFSAGAIGVLLLTGAFSLAIGRAFDFLNLSSLHSTYAARLTRTFQGASNEARVYTSTSNDAHDVSLAHPQDDLPHCEYHPEQQGGPLHFINVCVNETVDTASDREVRERKGLPMCVTPHGVSVGRRYFAKWAAPDEWPRWQKLRRWIAGLDGDDHKPAAARKLTALQALPVGSDPNAFHVLATKGNPTAEVESLSLGTWTAISGAAFSTGIGRGTRLPLALFMGLANVRLGYWWDSGIREQDRPGRYPPPLWRKLKRFPVTLFRMQSLLLAEWRARFHGAARWFWYLSDGGHFEVTGLYELMRRRVPLMIVTEAGEDPDYRWGDLALLTQQVRMDFGAQIEWLDPTPAAGAARPAGWAAFPGVPPWVQRWIKPDALGALKGISRTGTHHAALARVTYDKSPDTAWLLLLKPSIAPGLTEDIVNYAAENKDFPQQPTFDQVFDDIQWESHRALGQQIARKVLL